MLTRDVLTQVLHRYNAQKYSEDFYQCHLDVLRTAPVVAKPVEQAVEHLFLWKLGKVRTHKTFRSSPLEFRDSHGNQFHKIPVTGANSRALARATEQTRLQNGLAFRNGELSYEKFKEHARGIAESVVLPTFYVHIWRPSEYPILDEKVWKVFCDASRRTVCRYTKPRDWDDYEAYIEFFRKLVDSTGLCWRQVDQALWVLGSDLAKRTAERQDASAANRANR